MTRQSNNTSFSDTFQDSDSLRVVPFSNGDISHRALVDHRQRKLKPGIKVYPGGFRVYNLRGSTARLPHSQRGIISGFSANSRRRFRRLLMSIPWADYDFHFVTLTYHNEYGDNFQEYKIQLDNFIKAVRRHWLPYVGVLWRLEYQQRGAPHYHLVIFFRRGQLSDAGIFQRWASNTWARLIGGSDDFDLMRYGVKVIAGYRNKGLASLQQYIAKYMQKGDGVQLDPAGQVLNTGRVWGMRGGIARIMIAEILFSDSDQYALFIRNVNRQYSGKSDYLSSITTNWAGFSIFGDGLELMILLEDTNYRYVT